MSPALPDKDIDRLVKYWWTCWVGMHWAFRRHAAVYWACSGTISPTEALEVLGIDHPHPLEIVVFHRELVTTLVSEYDLANQIVKMTPEPEIKELRRFFAGRNAFASAEGSRNTVAQLIDAVTTPKGFPRLRMTDDGQAGRVPSARMVFDGIRRTSLMRSPNPPQNQDSAPLLFISSECPELISTLPSLIADTKRDPEDVMSLGTMQDDVWEACFDPRTLVSTEFGQLAISLIEPGMMVHTRNGLRRVNSSWIARRNASTVTAEFSNGTNIRCTPDHKFWSESRNSFIRLDALRNTDRLTVWRPYVLTEEITRPTAPDICNLDAYSSTGKYGPPRMGQSQRNTIFTILTAIRRTTRWITSHVCMPQNMPVITSSNTHLPRPTWRRLLSQLKTGASEIQNDLRILGVSALPHLLPHGHPESPLGIFARSVEMNISGLKSMPEEGCAARSVTSGGGENINRIGKTGYAQHARSHLIATSTENRSAAHISVLTESPHYAHLVSVKPSEPLDVWDIEVDGDHEFFANGILVSNCKNTYRDYPSVRDIEPLEVRRQKFIERAVTPTGQYMNMLKFNQEHSASNKRNRKR